MTDLIKIPGIGKKMAGHLASIGFPDIESLKGQDPEDIYTKHSWFQIEYLENNCLPNMSALFVITLFHSRP